MKAMKGHALMREGEPHDEHGQPCGREYGTNRSTEGPGRAKCECGALSQPVKNRRARRQWHRDHKDDLLAETWSASPVGRAILAGNHTPNSDAPA